MKRKLLTLILPLGALMLFPAFALAQNGEETESPGDTTDEVMELTNGIEETEEDAEEMLIATMDKEDKFLADDVVSQSEDVTGDLFAGAGQVTVTGNVMGDAFLGGNVSVSGDVLGSIYTAGGTVTIEGNVSGDVFVFGGQVTINGNVEGKVFAFAGMLTMNGDVGEDAYIFSGLANLNGNFEDDVRGSVGTLTLDGTVAGDLKAKASEFNKGDNASIGGTEDVTIVQERAGGQDRKMFDWDKFAGAFTTWFLVQKTLTTIGWIIVALLIIKFCPRHTDMMMRKLNDGNNWLVGFGLGILTMIVGPILFLLFLVSLLGMPLALVGGAGLTLAFMFSTLLLKTWIGMKVLNLLGQESPTYNMSAVVGVIVMALILFIPFLGPLFKWIVVTAAFGVYLQMLWTDYKKAGGEIPIEK